MVALDPGFGAEIFKIEPLRRLALVSFDGHRLDISRRQVTGKGFNHHIRDPDIGIKFSPPAAHIDPCQGLSVLEFGSGPEGLQGLHVIDPEADANGLSRGQLAREAPADADITMVIDDLAEDVPEGRLSHAQIT